MHMHSSPKLLSELPTSECPSWLFWPCQVQELLRTLSQLYDKQNFASWTAVFRLWWIRKFIPMELLRIANWNHDHAHPRRYCGRPLLGRRSAIYSISNSPPAPLRLKLRLGWGYLKFGPRHRQLRLCRHSHMAHNSGYKYIPIFKTHSLLGKTLEKPRLSHLRAERTASSDH
jgi:hypothetical protein